MTTYVRSSEAARLLGVSPATLYAYVSRGRIARVRAADGRTSLFAIDDLEALQQGSRRSATPRPTIDVQIASAITTLGDDGIEIRGHRLDELARSLSFEDVAELLWSAEIPPAAAMWERADPGDLTAVSATLDRAAVSPVSRLAIAAAVLAGRHQDDDAPAAARRLLLVAPSVLGSRRRTGRLAHRLTAAWIARPSTPLVDAVDTAMVLLSDHELATSTLAVRIAASVRTSPYAGLAAGLSTVEGALHGSAAEHAHLFLEDCHRRGPAEVIGAVRQQRQRIPGFGHKVYRRADPRFEQLLDAIRAIAPGDPRVDVIDEALATVVRTIPTQPNVDLALGALTWLGGLPPDAPIFAVARIAGWAAHFAEELTEPPVRFRGLARTPV